MQVLIPMAGAGSRFVKAGYQYPKPLIDVNGAPMIQRVVENILPLGSVSMFVFLVRSEHLKDFPNLRSTLDIITNGRSTVIEVSKLTEGAACTTLLAEEYLNPNESLLIANSDQLVEYNPNNFNVLKNHSEAIFFTFRSTHPKWSFVRIDDSSRIIEVAEKNPISDIATCGLYWIKHPQTYFNSVEKMIRVNDRVNGEFYVAPAFNYLIRSYGNNPIYPFFVEKMIGLGTPEDLAAYL